MKYVATLIAILALGLIAADVASAEMTVNLQAVADGLTAPLNLVSPPDGTKRRFITEQIGVIKILMPDGKILDEPFLNIQHRIVSQHAFFDERGLLGLAFHPDFKSNGRFFIAYSGLLPGDSTNDKLLWYSHTNYVAEYRVSKTDPNKADPTYERIVSKIDWPQFNHNGHWIGFGPDGFLYVSTGDGGYANDWGIGHNVTKGNGQDLTSINGKILRIDVNGAEPYAVPADNPFAGRQDVKAEIWAYGFRNPWRCSFDMGGTKQLFCADVGQNSFEEVDIVTKGGNYGWRVMEGKHCFDYVNPNTHLASCDSGGMTPPIMEYNNCNVTQDCKGLSITGGFVYRGSHQPWQGKYFFGDWSKQFAVRDGHIFVATDNGGNWTMEDVKVANMPNFNSYVLAFGQDGDGEVYVLTQDTTGPVGGLAKVYKIVP
ncbi:MAG TPA: PQQ-dependent sugar dehydrogenase [Methylomirabilota bacterium]|jgi:glucose/arabinose dehydrogenase